MPDGTTGLLGYPLSSTLVPLIACFGTCGGCKKIDSITYMSEHTLVKNSSPICNVTAYDFIFHSSLWIVVT